MISDKKRFLKETILVIIGNNSDTSVFNKSIIPYSFVDKIPVYNGNKRKLTSLVLNLPIEIIKVFFINSFF